LLMTTDLANPAWTPVTVMGTNNNVVVPRTNTQAFFQLISE